MPGFDFSYNLNMDQVKETSKLTNSFSVNQVVSPEVNLSGNGTFSAERTEGLDRFIDGRNGSGSLSWKPPGVEMSSSFQRSVSLEDRYGDRVRDDQTESATGSIRYSRGGWLNTNVSVGLQNIDYIRTSGDTTQTGNNDGNFHRISATVTRPFSTGSTPPWFTENRSYGNETENYTDGLNARLSYYFPESFRGGSLNAQLSGQRNSIIYIDSLEAKRGEPGAIRKPPSFPKYFPVCSLHLPQASPMRMTTMRARYPTPPSTIPGTTTAGEGIWGPT